MRGRAIESLKEVLSHYIDRPFWQITNSVFDVKIDGSCKPELKEITKILLKKCSKDVANDTRAREKEHEIVALYVLYKQWYFISNEQVRINMYMDKYYELTIRMVERLLFANLK